MINGVLMDQDELFAKNGRLIWSVANRYRVKGLSFGLDPEDLYNIAAIGMINAFKRFDPEKYPVKFSTYAVPMMKGEVQRFFRDLGGDVKFSRPIIDVANKIMREEMQEEPVEKLMLHFDEDEIMINDALYYIFNNRARSLHGTVYQAEGDEITLEDQIGNNKLADYTSANVKDFLESLAPRNRRMVELTMLGWTQAMIGQELGITQVQVSRLMRNLYDYIEKFFGYPVGYFQNRKTVKVDEEEKRMKNKAKKSGPRTKKGDLAKAKELLRTTKKSPNKIAKETGITEGSSYYWAKKIREPQEESPVSVSWKEPEVPVDNPEEVATTDKIVNCERKSFYAMGVPEEPFSQEKQFINNPHIELGVPDLSDAEIEEWKCEQEKAEAEAFYKKLEEDEKLFEKVDKVFSYGASAEDVSPSEIHTIFSQVGNVAASSGLNKLNVHVAVSTEKLHSVRGNY